MFYSSFNYFNYFIFNSALNSNIEQLHSANWYVESNAISPSKTYTIPNEVLSHKLVLLFIGKLGWYNSVILNKDCIKNGDLAGGGIVLDFSSSNSSVRDFIVIAINSSGVISLKYYPSWVDSFHVYSYGLF